VIVLVVAALPRDRADTFAPLGTKHGTNSCGDPAVVVVAAVVADLYPPATFNSRNTTYRVPPTLIPMSNTFCRAVADVFQSAHPIWMKWPSLAIVDDNRSTHVPSVAVVEGVTVVDVVDDKVVSIRRITLNGASHVAISEPRAT
jgi:hypothetical protein